MDIKAIIDILSGEFGYIAGLLALLLLVISFVISYRNRNKLVLEVATIHKELPNSFADFHSRLRNKIVRVSQIHQRTKDQAGDINIFRELSMPASGEAIAVVKEIENLLGEELNKPVKLLTLVFKWLFRPPRILIEILLANREDEGGRVKGDLKVECRYTAGGRQTDSIQLSPARRSGIVDEDIDGLAEEIAYNVLLCLSDSVGTQSWEALKYTTEALEAWPSAKTKAQEADERFAVSLAKLQQAATSDKNAPLVNYNLALIYYYEYSDTNMSEAIRHFELSTHTEINRFAYLGRIGLARCYCQHYHRMGKQTPQDLTQARSAAAQAVELIQDEKERLGLGTWTGYLKVDYARAMYCQAFSQHVTEHDKDIDKGISLYLDILKLYCQPAPDSFFRYDGALENPGELKKSVKMLQDKKPRVPAVIYNNLGYILMARGGRFEPQNAQANAYYELAREFFLLTFKRDPEYKFARANLGNLERLCGNYDQALFHYDLAIRIDPKYVNGFSERSWVYLQSGQDHLAREDHERAVAYAAEDSHKSKVKEYYARAHWRKGAHDSAKQYLAEAVRYDRGNENYELRDWVRQENELLDFLRQEEVEWQLLA